MPEKFEKKKKNVKKETKVTKKSAPKRSLMDDEDDLEFDRDEDYDI